VVYIEKSMLSLFALTEGTVTFSAWQLVW